MSREVFDSRLAEIDADPRHHVVVAVVEALADDGAHPATVPAAPSSSPEHPSPPPSTTRVVGAATLLLERKFIRGAGLAGHVEDVVVDASLRGRGVGRRLLAELVERARAAGAYKVILDCSEANGGFYASCGFKRKETQYARYLRDQ